MTNYDSDLLIVGGGPGGLATALHARRQGLSVIVAEPREDPIDKACGEGLMPGGLAELTSLDVDPAGMPLHGIAYVSEHRRAEARFRSGPGRGVRRTTLHAALAARAKEQDTEWIRTRVTSVQQDAHGVTAAGVRAKWLVAADGLHSAVRRAVGIKATAGTPRRYGVRWHFRVPAWSEFVEVHWSRWGEAYVTPVEPDLVGVAILSRWATRPGLVPAAGPTSAGRQPRAGPRLRPVAAGGLPPRRGTGAVGRRRGRLRGRADRRRHQPRRQASRRGRSTPLSTTHRRHMRLRGTGSPAITGCSPARWCWPPRRAWPAAPSCRRPRLLPAVFRRAVNILALHGPLARLPDRLPLLGERQRSLLGVLGSDQGTHLAHGALPARLRRRR